MDTEAAGRKHNRMNRKIFGILLICLVCIGNGYGHAQERRVRPGDRLTVTVVGREDLNRTVVVRADGTIQYPFLGSETISGFTLDQLRTLILIQLTRSLGSPPQAVDVIWSEEAAIEEIKISVLGQVAAPGVVLMDGQAGIQGALKEAGDLLPGARRNDIKLHRTTSDGVIVIPVDLERFLESGDASYLPPLQEGDVLVVPGGTLSTAVRVIGAVTSPGLYQAPAGATVFDMVLQAGGFADNARTDNIRLIKPNTGVSEEYKVNIGAFFRTGQKPASPPVEAGDVIIVPKRLISYRSILDGIQDIGSVLTIISFFVLISR